MDFVLFMKSELGQKTSIIFKFDAKVKDVIHLTEIKTSTIVCYFHEIAIFAPLKFY